MEEAKLIDIFLDRIHYYGGPHNLSVAIEAEAVRCNWHTVGLPFKQPNRCMWKKWEINYLLMYWRCCKQKDIALRINRTEISVRAKFYYLNKYGLV